MAKRGQGKHVKQKQTKKEKKLQSHLKLIKTKKGHPVAEEAREEFRVKHAA